jgi:hypothetical protein
MMLKFMAAAALLLLLISCNSVAQEGGLASENESAFADVQLAINDTAVTTTATVPEYAAPANLAGIWKVMIDGDEITMAVTQSGSALQGQCKSEAETPYNGAVSGLIAGNAASIAIAAAPVDVLTSTVLDGIVDGDSMEGRFATADGDGNLIQGDFSAERINIDVELYVPVKVPEIYQPAPVAATSAAEDQTSSQVQSQSEAAVQSPGRTFNDVRVLAKGIDPNIMPPSAPL